MSNFHKHAMREFQIAGWCDENGVFNDEMQKMMCDGVLKLLDVFAEEGHSGFSASYAISLFKKLVNFEPITALTGADDEWVDVGHHGCSIHYQNKRMSSVFKDSKDGQAYWMDGRVFWDWHKDDDGSMHKSYFTSRDSRVYIDFPWIKPESPEYVFRPSEEFPNEVL